MSAPRLAENYDKWINYGFQTFMDKIIISRLAWYIPLLRCDNGFGGLAADLIWFWFYFTFFIRRPIGPDRGFFVSFVFSF